MVSFRLAAGGTWGDCIADWHAGEPRPLANKLRNGDALNDEVRDFLIELVQDAVRQTGRGRKRPPRLEPAGQTIAAFLATADGRALLAALEVRGEYEKAQRARRLRGDETPKRAAIAAAAAKHGVSPARVRRKVNREP